MFSAENLSAVEVDGLQQPQLVDEDWLGWPANFKGSMN
jgi:hypothetical protein